ncbi:MAG: Mannonate dehydratase [Thermoproteota archaeon]|nr:Mannonate dehydratase [Thermoproteota archaeon]
MVCFLKITTNLNNFSENVAEDIPFLQQIGIDTVSFSLRPMFGPREGQVLESPRPYELDELMNNLNAAVKMIRQASLKANEFSFDITNALLGKAEGNKELDIAKALIKAAGDAAVSQIWVRPLGIRQGPGGVPGRYNRAHRGGYLMSAFSVKLMKEELSKRDLTSRWSHHFTNNITIEGYFDNLVKALQKLVPIAEDADVKLMLHTDDPPVPDSDNLLPGIMNPVLINRIFEAIPSKNLGLLFCVGTRYETGVDIYDQIRLFGNMGKIFAVHFRNVRGTLPSAGEYEEVMLDEGDMDMFEILKALKATGYDGTLSPDHPTIFIGDDKRRATLAWNVGYIRALLQALKSEGYD